MRICQPQQRLPVAHALVGVGGDADADGDPNWTARFSEVVGGNSPENTLGEVPGFSVGRLGQEHHELLPTIARYDIHGALFPLQQVGQLLQHPVAYQVAIRVVDLLEIVDVHHHAG